jgi:hypothetical protein
MNLIGKFPIIIIVIIIIIIIIIIIVATPGDRNVI